MRLHPVITPLGLALALILAGCSHGTVDSSGNIAVDPDEPYLLDEGTADTADVDITGLEASLAGAIASARRYNGDPAISGYALAMAEATSDCPEWYADSSGLPYWYDTCTTDAGASFSGYGYYIDYEGYSDGTYTWTGPAVYAAATIVTAAGDTFTGSGSAYSLVGDAESNGVAYTVYYSVVSGAFAWDGAGSGGTWVSEGGEPALGAWLTDYSGVHGAYFDGSVPVDPETGYDAAVFEEASISDPEAGWACPGEIAGTLSLHAVDGPWFEVLYTGDSAEDCDQCGRVWTAGVEIGEACVDGSAWVDWESSAPW